MRHGDFTILAEDYAKYRPGYSSIILKVILSLCNKPEYSSINAADIGAGTGIWSRMLSEAGVNVVAVEPNAAMRTEGEKLSKDMRITWLEGQAEHTGLPDCSQDIVTIASAFHWADFEDATTEFYRILKPGGFFAALWNPRNIQSNPLLIEIEEKLKSLVPSLKRVSSGQSEFCNGLTRSLMNSPYFSDVVYMEGFHTEYQSQERYIGLWKSVNDVQVQAGEEKFNEFIEYIKQETKDVESIEAEYLTRAWVARRMGGGGGSNTIILFLLEFPALGSGWGIRGQL